MPLRVPVRVRLALELLRRRRYVFVLSHMRSYSSLLTHIMNTHPEITGYVEMHQPYRTELDLLELRLRVYHADEAEKRSQGRFCLDKVLHNTVEITPRILQRGDVYPIFMVREPGRTIQSTVAMAHRKRKLDWKADPEKVGAYYMRRVQGLVDLARAEPAHSLFFDADLLVDEPDLVLSALTDYLGLKSPLQENYGTFELTGKPKFGDPSQYIEAGHIVKDRDDYGDIDVPLEVRHETERAYKDAVAALTEMTDLVVTGTS